MTGAVTGPNRPGSRGLPGVGEPPDEAGGGSPADSGGVPFAGRSLSESGFGGDVGAPDDRVRAALVALGNAPAPAAEVALLRAVAGTRVLVPVVAAPAGEPVRHHGSGEESDGAELSTVTLTGPDGRRALPVFTGVDTLAAWDASARPVPVRIGDAARSAIEDGCEALLLDLGAPHVAVLRLSHVWALAQEREWVPAFDDPVVRLAVAEAAQGIDGLVRARAHDGARMHGPGVLRLVLTLAPGLPAARTQAIVATLGERLAADPEVRIRIDDLAVVLHRADTPEDAVPPDAEPPDAEPPDAPASARGAGPAGAGGRR